MGRTLLMACMAMLFSVGCSASIPALSADSCVIDPDSDDPCASIPECIQLADGPGNVVQIEVRVGPFSFGLCDSREECDELLEAAVEAACDEINFNSVEAK